MTGEVSPWLAELLAGGQWRDVTADAVRKSGMHVEIQRGRQSEDSRVTAGWCRMALANRSGDYSPRWPAGRWHGLIGRNTGFRLSHTGGPTWLRTERHSTSAMPHGAASTPGHVSLDITGDIDIRVGVAIAGWSAHDYTLASKWLTTGDQRSWRFGIHSDGALEFSWSPDGTFAAVQSRVSALPVDWWSAQGVRVTLDVDDGAAGHTVTFYTSTDGSTWQQLGASVTGVGVTSVNASTAEVRVGGRVAVPSEEGLPGRWRSFQLRDGIDGTTVAAPDFTAQTPGATSFTDSVGRGWHVNTALGAEVTDRRGRFAGEVAEWPQRWDGHGEGAGDDAYTLLEAWGILRRLAQGSHLKSAIYRELTAPDRPSPVAYWPCEDGEDSTQLASAVPGPPMVITGAPDLASYSDLAASSPLPTMRSSRFVGVVPPVTSTGRVVLRLVVHIPADGIDTTGQICGLRVTGSANLWQVVYLTGTGGDLKLVCRDVENNVLLDTGAIGFDIDGTPAEIKVDLTQNGLTVDWRIGVRKLHPDGTSSATELAGNLDSAGGADTVGRAVRVSVNYDQVLDAMAVGHVVVANNDQVFSGIVGALTAWHGETAGARLTRLCAEERVPFRGVGRIAGAVGMGAQRPGTLLDLLRECEEADGGILHETRDEIGLTYRARESLYNQPATVALDYQQRHLSPPLEPVEDDRGIHNDITIRRVGGSSARAVLETGPLSVQPPPDGAGRYESQHDVNLSRDTQLPDHAAWRLHLDTRDAARYPTVAVSAALNPDLTLDIAAVDTGDRVTIDQPPAPLPPDQVDLLTQGYSESADGISWDIAYHASPGGPWRVGVLDDHQLGRLDTDGSNLTAPADATATTLSVGRRGSVLEDFEDDDIILDLSGTWARSTTRAHAGTWSLKSAAISHNDQTDAVVQVPPDATTLTFWHLVSSETGFDFFRFYLDGVEQFAASGPGAWTEKVFDVAGVSEVTFRYTKDISDTTGDDAAYIDMPTFDVDQTTPLWTTDPAEFPFDIHLGGERVTVTAITGTSAPQTFTVVRSVNGVVKAHDAGADVRLWQPMTLPL